MKNTKKIIGVCGSNLFNQQPLQFILALREECSKYDYCITALCCSSEAHEYSNDITGDKELIELIHHIPFDGIVFFSETIFNSPLRRLICDICHEKHIPLFVIDGSLEGCYNMIMDNSSGFEAIVRHVVEHHGCRRINMLAGFKDNPFSDERINAYKKVLKENNIPIEDERIEYGDFWSIPAERAMRKFLNSSLPIPEAIVCANDSMAVTACSVLYEAGYNIPDDIIVTGFDGIESGQYHVPVLSTCQPDYKNTSKFILSEIEKARLTGDFTPIDKSIPYKPLIQQSCGCKPATLHNQNHIVTTLYTNNGDSAWHNISMNELITANLYHDNIMELAKILPQHVNLWKDHYRFTCVKSDLMSSSKVPEGISELMILLHVSNEEFLPTGKIFVLDEIIPSLLETITDDILIINLLNSGKTVYGYNVEGFVDIDQRKMQRCSDFSFFLSYCINNILHNSMHKELTQGLIKANHEISKMAFHDSMTGLLNRQGFFNELEPILTQKSDTTCYLYIFSVDMNRLKYINDTFGHAAGDCAITTLADSLTQTIYDNYAICSRFGGDEFVVAVTSEYDDTYTCDEFVKRLHSIINNHENLVDKPYFVTASVGMYCLPVTPNMNLESIIASADKQMYDMKKNTRT